MILENLQSELYQYKLFLEDQKIENSISFAQKRIKGGDITEDPVGIHYLLIILSEEWKLTMQELITKEQDLKNIIELAQVFNERHENVLEYLEQTIKDQKNYIQNLEAQNIQLQDKFQQYQSEVQIFENVQRTMSIEKNKNGMEQNKFFSQILDTKKTLQQEFDDQNQQLVKMEEDMKLIKNKNNMLIKQIQEMEDQYILVENDFIKELDKNKNQQQIIECMELEKQRLCKKFDQQEQIYIQYLEQNGGNYSNRSQKINKSSEDTQLLTFQKQQQQTQQKLNLQKSRLNRSGVSSFQSSPRQMNFNNIYVNLMEDMQITNKYNKIQTRNQVKSISIMSPNSSQQFIKVPQPPQTSKFSGQKHLEDDDENIFTPLPIRRKSATLHVQFNVETSKFNDQLQQNDYLYDIQEQQIQSRSESIQSFFENENNQDSCIELQPLPFQTPNMFMKQQYKLLRQMEENNLPDNEQSNDFSLIKIQNMQRKKKIFEKSEEDEVDEEENGSQRKNSIDNILFVSHQEANSPPSQQQKNFGQELYRTESFNIRLPQKVFQKPAKKQINHFTFKSVDLKLNLDLITSDRDRVTDDQVTINQVNNNQVTNDQITNDRLNNDRLTNDRLFITDKIAQSNQKFSNCLEHFNTSRIRSTRNRYNNKTASNKQQLLNTRTQIMRDSIISFPTLNTDRNQEQDLPPAQDPYQIFMTLTGQCAKLNCKYFENICYMKIDQLFEEIKINDIPIQKWQSYLTEKLDEIGLKISQQDNQKKQSQHIIQLNRM